jgi:hypothetical protein
VGLAIFHVIFLNIPHIHIECGEYLEILREILLVPQNIVMDLKEVMGIFVVHCVQMVKHI